MKPILRFEDMDRQLGVNKRFGSDSYKQEKWYDIMQTIVFLLFIPFFHFIKDSNIRYADATLLMTET